MTLHLSCQLAFPPVKQKAVMAADPAFRSSCLVYSRFRPCSSYPGTDWNSVLDLLGSFVLCWKMPLNKSTEATWDITYKNVAENIYLSDLCCW